MRWIILGLFTMVSNWGLAATVISFDTLGASSKGQYVALEEYGYHPSNGEVFSKIRVINIWKNKDMKTITHTLPSKEETALVEVRNMSRSKIDQFLKKYNISN